MSSPEVPRGRQGRRGSSFTAYAGGLRGATGLEARVLEEEAKLQQVGENGEEPQLVDPLEDHGAFLELLNMDEKNRESLHVEKIFSGLTRLAPEFCTYFSDEQIGELARGCLYHWFAPGSTVCQADEDTE